MKYILFAALLALPMSTVGYAQSSVTMSQTPQVIDEYRAFIGLDDLHNSRGVRLTKPWEVLRQDRANFHQYGTRQKNEDGDSFFASVENRAKMEAMVRDGFTSQEAGDAIVNGNVWVKVQIIGYGSTGKLVRISVE